MAKKAKYASIVNYDGGPTRVETLSDEQMTVSGDAYTIRELMARYANGQRVGVEREAIYEDTEDFDFPDVSKLRQMDLYDRTSLFEEVEEKMRVARDAIKAYQEAQASSEPESEPKDADKANAADMRSKDAKEASNASDGE